MKKETEVDVPDSIRPYLNEIAQRLWAGRAAVMVGAGFSKNAGREFLDWNELGDLFYQKAHGVKPDPRKQKYLNVLRLAEEVLAAIGRPALEELIRASTPDQSVEPSDLHVELLKLPWDDVFTTNYDTLLERARAKVDTRRYEPVVNKEDIPYAIKPRIVKLHGSFPSERPFIITEEDYRRYPHEFAPFVNTVQQALLENTFCLVGFSGDDPNFLQWIGWLRDNLGNDKTQKIYLVGLFDLPSARLQLLAQRGIIVVDFSCCDDIEKHDHKKALKRFFEYMQSWRPDGLDWPYNPNFMQPAGDDTTRIDEFRRITEEWRRQRHSYPGWLILPYSNRENLWTYTDAWLNHTPNTEEMPNGLDIQYAFELIWRLERCLLPIFDNIAEICEKLLEKYWPFQLGNPPSHCQFDVRDNEFQDLPWECIREAWLTTALAMLRFYREEGLLEKRRTLGIRLRTAFEYLSTEQREFLSYEEYLFSLFTLDLPKATQCLENWRPNDSQPYWMSKRAASLAEIGHLIDTEEQIRRSLVESRRKSNYDAASSGYRSVSNEAYQMLLLRYAKDASEWIMDRPATPEEEKLLRNGLENDWKTGKRRSESEEQANSAIKPSEVIGSFADDWGDLSSNRNTTREADWKLRLKTVRNTQRKRELQQQNARWDEIKAFRCDPWNELKLYELMLDRPSAQRKNITKKRGFDIGQVSQTHHLHDNDREALRAYSFLRFCEEIGLPYRIGSFTMATKTAFGSLRRISRTSSFWATATLARLGDSKAVDSLFNRESVVKFSVIEADHLIQTYLDAIDKCRGDIHAGDAFRNNNFGVRLAQLLPEIISRLCCKCSVNMKHKILDFIAELYASLDKSKYGNVKNLTKRLIASMTDLEQYALIPTLLEIPIPDDLSLMVKDEFWNPFLLLDVEKKPESAADLEIQPGLVDDLLRESVSDNADRRRWAISSLVTLQNLNLLDQDLSKKLGDAIWQFRDESSFPANTDYYKFALLRLPHPESIDPIALFKKYVKATSFPVQKTQLKSGVNITGGNIHLVNEIIRASNTVDNLWSAKDVADILHRLIEWWDADKEQLDENVRESVWISKKDEFRARFSRIVELLAEVVGPMLGSDSPRNVKGNLSRLLMEMREYALPVLVAEAACLHIYPGQKKDICFRISDALISNQDSIEIDALRAIGKIITNCTGAFSRTLKTEVVSMLNQYLTWCPIHSSSSALGLVVRILKDAPSGFTDELQVAVLRRLERVLSETSYDNKDSDVSFDERLHVRKTASVLAAALWEFYRVRNLSVPRVVEDWRSQCLSPNEFPEVRNAW